MERFPWIYDGMWTPHWGRMAGMRVHPKFPMRFDVWIANRGIGGLMRLRSAAEADAGGTHKQREQSSFAGALLGARWLGV